MTIDLANDDHFDPGLLGGAARDRGDHGLEVVGIQVRSDRDRQHLVGEPVRDRQVQIGGAGHERLEVVLPVDRDRVVDERPDAALRQPLDRRLDTPAVVETYKPPSAVERDFRALKGDDLAVRPIFHWREDRVRAHLFLCFLAAYVRWHLEQAWAPLLFRDEAPPTRTDPVAPPERSPSALAKERDHRTPDGPRVGSFATLMAELATLTRNRVVPAGADERAAFDLLSEPTPLQARAFELIGVTPASV